MQMALLGDEPYLRRVPLRINILAAEGHTILPFRAYEIAPYSTPLITLEGTTLKNAGIDVNREFESITRVGHSISLEGGT